MKTKQILLIFVTLLLTIQCKKEYTPGNTTTIKGYMIDVSKGEPIDNGEIQLIKSYIPSPGYMICCYGIRNIIYTNQSGRFEFTFKHDPDSLYDLASTAPGYSYNYAAGGDNQSYPLCVTGMVSVNDGYTNTYYNTTACGGNLIDEISEGIIDHAQIRIAPFGTLRVHIKNVPPANNLDKIQLSLERNNLQVINHSGANVDTYESTSTYANRYARILYNKTIDGQFSAHEDSVYIKSGETTEFLLEF